jgi:hypothetical protein
MNIETEANGVQISSHPVEFQNRPGPLRFSFLSLTVPVRLYIHGEAVHILIQ